MQKRSLFGSVLVLVIGPSLFAGGRGVPAKVHIPMHAIPHNMPHFNAPSTVHHFGNSGLNALPNGMHRPNAFGFATAKGANGAHNVPAGNLNLMFNQVPTHHHHHHWARRTNFFNGTYAATPFVTSRLHVRRSYLPWYVWGFTPAFPTGLGLAGQVTAVPSGNSLMVNNAVGQPQPVRLFGVAAPVVGQAYAIESQAHLSNRVLGTYVHVRRVGTDLDGSSVGKVFLSGSYINAEQVRSGMAWNLADDGYAPELVEAESEAQSSGAGLWSESDPVAPWLYASLTP